MGRFIIAILAVVIAGCATPMPPTGGQPLRTPPSIVSTSPQQGAVHVDSRVVRFDFNRFMNRGTAMRAVRIEPDVGIPYEINWKRRSMVITFERSLPDSVTVIVSLGTELSDVENNRLGQPFQLAFSTGSSVDSAGVDITTISFDKARGEEGVTVGLFRGGDLTDAAVYVAESDTAGIVRFRHATPGLYTAVLFDDRNRNRRLDPDERHSYLPNDVSVDADSIRNAGSVYYAVQDTIRPSILGVGMLSNQRVRVRFSESIRIGRSSEIETITDGVSQLGYWLYSDPDDPSIAYANAGLPLKEGASYNVLTRGVADFSGNMVRDDAPVFIGSGQADTTRMRIVRLPESPTLLHQDSVMVVYSGPIQGTAVVDSLIVVDGETAIRGWQGVHLEQNRMYIYRDGGWRADQNYQLRLWDPLLQRHQPVSFRPLDPAELGALEIVADSTWSDQAVMLEVVAEDGSLIRRIEFTDRTVISGLVPGSVAVRSWIDRNGNGRWDQGSLVPMAVAAEPVFIQKGIPITARMTAVLEVGRTFY